MFARYEGSVERIFIADADGSHARRLSHEGQMDQSPAFSPDARLIVFKSDRTGDNQLWAMFANGSRQTQITKRPGGIGAPSFSPDGRKLLFETGEQNGRLKVTVMRAGRQHDLANGGGPAFSPGGRKIAFWRFKRSHYELWVMNADGSHQHRLNRSVSSNYISRPSYSPNGRRIAFQSLFRGIHQVFVMNADGSHPTRLTKCPQGCLAPTFSPDGRRIAYLTTNANLYMMDPDGLHQKFIARHVGSDDFVMDWGVAR